MEQTQHKIVKFALGSTYNLTLEFDEPKEFEGKFGPSIMYGAKMEGEEIRFYASPGLHAEIQKQGLKKGSGCNVQKVQPGDFPYFIVNGKSKHELQSVEDFKADANNAPAPAQAIPAPVRPKSDAEKKFNSIVDKVNEMYVWYQDLKTTDANNDNDNIPF